MGLPSSIMDLIESRLCDLEPEDKDLLDVAACCGASFDPLLVAEALGMPEIPALKRLARIDQKFRLIHAQGRRYDFDHNLVHEVLYERLSPLLREHYHSLLARALEARVGEGSRSGEIGVEICRHSLRGGVAEAAQPYLMPALDHLEASHRVEAALDLAETALGSEGLLVGGDRVRVILRKAGRLEILGRREEEATALLEALRLGESIDDARLGARIRRRLGRNALTAGRPEDARARFREAFDLAVEAEDHREQATCLGHLGEVARELGRTAEAFEFLGRAIEISRRTGDLDAEATACLRLGALMHDAGRLEESAGLADRAVRITRETGDRIAEGSALVARGDVALDAGDLEAARETHRTALDLFRETGHRRGEGRAECGLGASLLFSGRYEESEGHLDHALQIAKEVEDRRGEARVLGWRGRLRIHLGDARGARETVHALADLTASAPSVVSPGEESLLRGRLAELVESLTEALELHRQALEAWRRSGSPLGQAQAHLAIGRILLRQDRRPEALEHLERAREVGEEAGIPAIFVPAVVARAVARDDLEPARSLLRETEERLGPRIRMDAHHALHEAGAPESHLVEAGRLQSALTSAAPASRQASMLENVPLHRAVRAALEELQ